MLIIRNEYLATCVRPFPTRKANRARDLQQIVSARVRFALQPPRVFHRHDDGPIAEREIRDVERYKLRPPERAREDRNFAVPHVASET